MLKRILIVLILSFCMLAGVGVYFLEKDWIDFSALEAYKTAKPSVILDDEGCVLARFELDKRAPVSYDQIPDMVIKAFVATEDRAFFTHAGISFKGIIRSSLVNLYHRRIVQGASTITQQLARLMFLSYERTWMRKVQEVMLAFQLERQLSKQQILELYLNNIYFGRGIYGVEAASRRFWNKPLSHVTVEEAATLAAVAASARLYSPLNAPGNAKKRRGWVLSRMFRQNYIDKKTYEAATKKQLQIQDYAMGNPIRLYLQEWVRQWAESKWGKDALYSKGLKIKTTINKVIQEKAEQAFATTVHQLRRKMGSGLNGGMMSIVPSTGQVKVMIGGYDFKQSQFNRATQACRQMGSSFKPMLYALAMRAGIPMESVFIDEPLELQMPNGELYKPRNWDYNFHGAMTLVRALTYSKNTIAIKLFLKIGGQYIIPWAKMFGINRELTDYPSAALGTAEVTVEENVAAFNVFANNGIYVKPYLVEWVKDENGIKLWENVGYDYRVLDSTLCSKMVNLLSQRMIMAKRQWGDAWIKVESIGKTGSTNGATTTWFVGATPTLTTAVYVGCDDNAPMGDQLLAGRTTFPLWMNFYKSLELPVSKSFYIEPSLKEVAYNWFTGAEVARSDDPDVVVLLK